MAYIYIFIGLFNFVTGMYVYPEGAKDKIHNRLDSNKSVSVPVSQCLGLSRYHSFPLKECVTCLTQCLADG